MAGSTPVRPSLAAGRADRAASISADRAVGVSKVGAQGDVDLADTYGPLEVVLDPGEELAAVVLVDDGLHGEVEPREP